MKPRWAFMGIVFGAAIICQASASERFGTLQGEVVDPHEQPIQDVKIVIKRSTKKAITGRDGKFKIEHIFPGQYALFVYKAGYFSRSDLVAEVKRNQVSSIRIVLEPDVQNRGYGRIEGQILTMGGRPLEGAKITIAEGVYPRNHKLMKASDIKLVGQKFEFVSNEEGSFAAKIPAGKYIALVIRDGYKAHLQFSLYVESGQTTKLEVTLQSTTRGSIVGKVLAADGRELPGAHLEIAGTKWGTAAGPEGNFVFPEVPPGLYVVKASYIGYSSRKSQPVKVEAGKTITANFILRPENEASQSKIAELEKRLEELRTAYFNEGDQAARQQVKQQMREVLQQIFELKETQQAMLMKSLNRELEKMQKLHRERQKNRDKIIERRLEELLKVYVKEK
ncbi:MAG: hypothetical protein D6814_11045 [Calditrichaeota bacterium]|nr:MAG: hypothetical protein D6814_11045 [Calditrichota bacterium]